MQIAVLIPTLTLLLLTHGEQQQAYSVQGSVTVDGHFSSQPVLVYLEALSARPVEQIFTDGSGNFSFQDVPAGTYYVRVEHDGFEEFAQRIEVPGYNRDVMIFLQRRKSVPTAAGEIALGTKFQVDIRQLSVPENAVREYQKALDENRKGKISSAIDRFRRALSIAPNFIEAAFHLGATLYQIGHFEDAEEILKRALKIAPKEPRLHLMLANVFVKEGKYQQALSEIDTYLRDNPDGPERASALTTRSQLIRAIQR